MTNHYGPVRIGKWYGALCRATPTQGHPISMTTHQPWIDCPACLKSRGRQVSPAQVAKPFRVSP